ncbi:MAG: sulfotransferase [Bacteroidota bacterium]
MSRVKYIYILSQRYSGSTLLSFLLATHPDIATIGERRKFYNKSFQPGQGSAQRCSCGELFADCEHWQGISERIRSRLEARHFSTNFTEFELFETPILNKLWDRWFSPRLFRKLYADLYEANQVLVEEILALNEKPVFLDSSKSYKQLQHLQEIEAFDLKVIWLSRDPRAQVSSALKYNSWTVQQAADTWVAEMKQYETLLQKGGFDFLPVRYEQLCRTPLEEMRRILQYLQLDDHAFSLDFRGQEQHIMGNKSMRLGADRKIEERKDWQERLKPAEVSLIETITQAYTKFYSPS